MCFDLACSKQEHLVVKHIIKSELNSFWGEGLLKRHQLLKSASLIGSVRTIKKKRGDNEEIFVRLDSLSSYGHAKALYVCNRWRPIAH